MRRSLSKAIGIRRIIMHLCTLLLSVQIAHVGNAQAASKSAKKITFTASLDTFDYIAGTQAFGSNYHFTDDGLLIESAMRINEMGSNMIKFGLGPNYVKNNYIKNPDPDIHSLVQLASQRDYKTLFSMPFSRYFIWTYAYSTNGNLWPWHGHMQQNVLDKEYTEIYDLTRYLLTTYNDTGKMFFVGNWEGDWHLIAGAKQAVPKWETEVNPDAPQGMVDWLTVRQKAVDDAKRDTPHRNVQVWFYVEANLVQRSVKQNRISVASKVIPFVNPDYVSYSSYDSTNPDKDLHHDLPAALDYLQSRLKPKPGLLQKRVFVGEYGVMAHDFNPQQQDARMRDVIITSIQWGVPFVLYWQLYDNETRGADPAGFWLINNKNVKQPAYFTYQHYYADAKEFVAGFEQKNNRLPSDAEFRSFALKWFTTTTTRNQ
jgi:hypothetical protein